jgi:hypothetical protein
MRFDAYRWKACSPQRRLTEHWPATPRQLSTCSVLLCSCIYLIIWRGRTDRLHELDEIGVGAVHDSDATWIDITTDGDEAPEENVVEHEDGDLADSIPGTTVRQARQKRAK